MKELLILILGIAIVTFVMTAMLTFTCFDYGKSAYYTIGAYLTWRVTKYINLKVKKR